MGKSKKHKSEKKSKKKHKHKDHKEKKKAKKLKKETKQPKEKTDEKKKSEANVVGGNAEELLDNFAIPLELMNNKSHAPETPAEYQKRQSYIRRETDPVTGRIRLIKGDGEILEEIVGKERHVEINKQATQGDGRYFQEKTFGNAGKPKRK